MTGVRAVGTLGTPAPEPRAHVDGGFADSLDALLRPRPAPAPDQHVDDPRRGGVQFSRHATARLESRAIRLDEQDVADLGTAMDQLARRGARTSLVLMGDHAFIVGVPDRRVITAMSRQEAAGNIFTQIDSTAVVR